MECKFQEEWQSYGMLLSTRGATFARKCCNTDISFAHGVMNDVRRHLATSKHQDIAKAAASSGNLRAFFRQSPIEEKVTRAEHFIAEHNLSFMTADHFTHLTSAMFPDSKVAKAFSCARTKTTCIVKGALHPHFAEPVIKQCKESPFSILCDEGNDTDDKNLAILVHLWDDELSKPVTWFLDMPVCNIGTAEKLFDHIEAAIDERGIPWSNVVGFESDTTNVMMGKHSSVLSRVKVKQPMVYIAKVVCHLANLCLLAGVKALPVDVDLFYHFGIGAALSQQFPTEGQERVIAYFSVL